MKKIIFIAAFFLVFPPHVSAHLPGQPSFFKVNGTYADYYHVPSTSLSDFALPQDQAPSNYLINQPIEFEVDTGRLGIAENMKDKLKLYWDYGDGTKGQRRITNHLYKKIGSYMLTIYADDGQAPTPQLLETMRLNILPNKDYRLPQAIITINGKQSKDPLVDILYVDLRDEIILDSSKSNVISPVSSYIWDFGDGGSASGKKQTHIYKKDLKSIFPVLRIRDKNGFIADAYVQITNKTRTNSSATPHQSPSGFRVILPYLLGAIIFFFIGVVLFSLKKRRK